MELLISKFNTQVEIIEYISYVKLMDKRDNSLINDLTNDIYDLIKEKKTTKKEIKNTISKYTKIFLPNTLNEEKISCYYDVFTNEFIDEKLVSNDNKDTLFKIVIKQCDELPFDKEKVNNYLSDKYNSELFIFDIRHYTTNKKYYTADFEIYLSENGFFIKSDRKTFVNYFLQQYDMSSILTSLKLDKNYEFSGNFLYIKDTFETIENLYTLDKMEIKSLLYKYYRENEFIFINNCVMKNLNIEISDLITNSDTPKLVILLEKDSYDSLNYNRTSKINKLEVRDKLYILHITETLFRESCGYNTHILFMTNDGYFALSKFDSEYEEYTFMSKVKVNGNKYLSSILYSFAENNNESSYLDELHLLSFVLSSEEMSNLLNFYIVNNVKLGQDNKVNYYQNTRREKISLSKCKEFLKFIEFIKRMDKVINFSYESLEVLIAEAKDAIVSISDSNLLFEYKELLIRIVDLCDINSKVDSIKLENISNLIDFKRLIKEQTKQIKYILDSNVFIENPDVLSRYFYNKNVVIPSIIIDEINEISNININATRALRGINILRERENINLEIIKEIDTSYLGEGHDKTRNDNKLLALALKYKSEGIYPIIVSNSIVSIMKFKQENIDVISSEFLKMIK